MARHHTSSTQLETPKPTLRYISKKNFWSHCKSILCSVQLVSVALARSVSWWRTLFSQTLID